MSTSIEADLKRQRAFDRMASAMRGLEREVTQQAKEVDRFLYVVDLLSWDDGVCRGCGVDNTTDWQGLHRESCYVDAARRFRK